MMLTSFNKIYDYAAACPYMVGGYRELILNITLLSYKNIKLYVDIFISHVDINKLHVDIIISHVIINILHDDIICKKKK